MHSDHEFLRRVQFNLGGQRFALTLWDTHRTDSLDKSVLAYRLNHNGRTLFAGDDFCASPMYAIDADETVKGLMCFLTLRPGDTDAEYFADYTDAQREYCNLYAEQLDIAVRDRFGWDD